MKNLLSGIKRLFGIKPALTKEVATKIIAESVNNCTSQWFDTEKEKARLRNLIQDNYATGDFIVTVKRSRANKGVIAYRWLIFTTNGERWRYEITKNIKALV